MYKLNIIIIFCLCIATIFADAAPLNIPQSPSSSLTARSAAPLDLNSNASAMYQAKKRRGLVNSKLDLPESELDRPQAGNRIIKRDPIDYTINQSPKEITRFNIKRAQKKERRSIIRKLDDNSILFK